MDLNLIMNSESNRVAKRPAPIKVDAWDPCKQPLVMMEEVACPHPTPAASPTAESTVRMPSQEPWMAQQLQQLQHQQQQQQQQQQQHQQQQVPLPVHPQSYPMVQQLPTPVLQQQGSPTIPQQPQMIPVISSIEVKGVVIDKKTRRFVCQVCKKEFIRKSGLVRHNLIHLGVRPNKCTVCNKQFLQKSALTVHYRIHSGEKPYSCRHCGRRFGDSSSLCRHYRMHLAKGEGGK